MSARHRTRYPVRVFFARRLQALSAADSEVTT